MVVRISLAFQFQGCHVSGRLSESGPYVSSLESTCAMSRVFWVEYEVSLTLTLGRCPIHNGTGSPGGPRSRATVTKPQACFCSLESIQAVAALF